MGAGWVYRQLSVMDHSSFIYWPMNNQLPFKYMKMNLLRTIEAENMALVSSIFILSWRIRLNSMH